MSAFFLFACFRDSRERQSCTRVNMIQSTIPACSLYADPHREMQQQIKRDKWKTSTNKVTSGKGLFRSWGLWNASKASSTSRTRSVMVTMSASITKEFPWGSFKCHIMIYSSRLHLTLLSDIFASTKGTFFFFSIFVVGNVECVQHSSFLIPIIRNMYS